MGVRQAIALAPRFFDDRPDDRDLLTNLIVLLYRQTLISDVKEDLFSRGPDKETAMNRGTLSPAVLATALIVLPQEGSSK